MNRSEIKSKWKFLKLLNLKIYRASRLLSQLNIWQEIHINFSTNFKHISNIFGYLPQKSIIVLGTKSNQRKETFLKKVQGTIRENMIKHHIPEQNYLRFMTPFEELNESLIDNQQYAKLQAIIKKCKPVQLKYIQEKKEMIKSIALRIQQEETKTIQNEYQTQKVDYKTKKQAYTVTVPREQQRGRVGKIFGKHLGGKKIVYHTETHQKDIKVPYTVTEKVKNYTNVSPQYQYCYAKALQEFESQILSSLVSK